MSFLPDFHLYVYFNLNLKTFMKKKIKKIYVYIRLFPQVDSVRCQVVQTGDALYPSGRENNRRRSTVAVQQPGQQRQFPGSGSRQPRSHAGRRSQRTGAHRLHIDRVPGEPEDHAGVPEHNQPGHRLLGTKPAWHRRPLRISRVFVRATLGRSPGEEHRVQPTRAEGQQCR